MSQTASATAYNKPILPTKIVLALGVSSVAVAALSPYVTPYMLWATFAYLMMVSGLVLRKQRKVHVSFMSSAIFMDLALVLVLEINRNAVKTALDFTLGPLQQMHIGFSTLAVLFYFPIVFLGVKHFRGKGTGQTRKWHLRLGVVSFVFRTLGFVMMFSLLYK